MWQLAFASRNQEKQSVLLGLDFCITSFCPEWFLIESEFNSFYSWWFNRQQMKLNTTNDLRHQKNKYDTDWTTVPQQLSSNLTFLQSKSVFFLFLFFILQKCLELCWEHFRIKVENFWKCLTYVLRQIFALILPFSSDTDATVQRTMKSRHYSSYQADIKLKAVLI